jgi:ABC-type multidrug transport system ATPase subunit
MCSKNTVEALRNITFEIDNNELMAVLGHNGAGKTTLINILTGVSSPDPSTDL